jgi:hypothetical protein
MGTDDFFGLEDILRVRGFRSNGLAVPDSEMVIFWVSKWHEIMG